MVVFFILYLTSHSKLYLKWHCALSQRCGTAKALRPKSVKVIEWMARGDTRGENAWMGRSGNGNGVSIFSVTLFAYSYAISRPRLLVGMAGCSNKILV